MSDESTKRNRLVLTLVLALQQQHSISTDNTKKLNIVGTQYYPGEAHQGEYVKLIREPHNPYDRNAVKVCNMQGQQVGHIKREIAAILSPLMRRMPELRCDATIPRPAKNAYTIPIQIDFYGPDATQASYVEGRFSYFVKASAKKKKAPPKLPEAAATASQQQVTVQTKKLDWKSQQQQLDDMFNKVRSYCILSLLYRHLYCRRTYIFSFS